MLASIKAALAAVLTTIKSSIPTVAIVATTTVVTGGCIYYYTVKDGIYEKDTSNVRYVLEECINEITINSIVPNNNGGYTYATDLDKKIDELFTKYQSAYNTISSYIDEDKEKEVIKKFIKAEIIGQYPDLRTETEILNDEPIRENELQGGIKIVRPNASLNNSGSSNSELTYDISPDDQILTYIPYSEFSSRIINNDTSITNYFTLNKWGDIVVAGWKEETSKVEVVEYVPNEDGTETVNTSTTTSDPVYELCEIQINYKNSLTKYSMPASFLWSLLVAGESTSFVENLADLAINNTEIVIEAHDNIEKTVDSSVEKYICTKTINVPVTNTISGDASTTTPVTLYASTESTKTTTIETKESNTILNLVYAKTWIATNKKVYNNTIDAENNSNSYINIGTTTQEQIDIDEENNFVTYFNNSAKAKKYILESTSWLYEMLESHEKTANMLDLVKYLLYQSTNFSYGVTTYNFNEYNFDEFESSQISSGVNCPRYYQMDSRWSSNFYNYKSGGTIGRGGCGACALAMAVSGLTGYEVTPDIIVNYLNSLNLNTISNGAECAKKVAEKYGLTYEFINRTNKAKIDQALANRKCLIFSVTANGIYTGEGHYIMCNGTDGNNYYVLESSRYYETDRPYAFDQVFTNGNQGIFAIGR